MTAHTGIPLASRIARLQRLLKGHPRSPLFARLADCYIEAGDPERALQTCLEGIKTYPEYASAHLVLAKSLMLLRRFHDARESLKKVMEFDPTSGAAQELLTRSQELERQYPAPERFSQPRIIAESDGIPSAEEIRRSRWSSQENLIPGSTLFKRTDIPLSVPEEQVESMGPELDLESLAEKLEHARIPIIEESAIPMQTQEIPTPPTELQRRPMTETLAAIYLGQGRYDEALRVYEHLLQKYPARARILHDEIEKIRSLLSESGKESSPPADS